MPSTFSPPDGLDQTDPDFHTPSGPVWRVDAEAILEREVGPARPFLLRKLPAIDSMLHIAPLFEQVTRFDHPRLWGPSYWARSDDALWVAAPEPRGVRLVEADLDRLTFHEALDLWRPLAEAVSRLHRRGLVHGQITPWNTWVDTAKWAMTVTDAGCWVGEDLAAMSADDAVWLAPEMRAGVTERDPTPATDIHGLGRLLLYLTLPADQTGSERPNLQGIPGFAIPTLESAIDQTPGRRPQRVAQFVSAMAPRTDGDATVDSDTTGDDLVTVLHARVAELERFEHPERGAGIKFELRPQRADTEAPAHRAFFYEAQAPDVYEGVRHVWEGCELNLIDARVVENSEGERFLTAHPTTLPVLEPHMPMSVSAVLSAQGCPSRFLVDQRDRGESSRPLVFGNLVHGLLDDLVAPDPPDFETAYEERLRELRVDLLAAGLGDVDLGDFREDARRHYRNIRRFTEPRTDRGPADDRVGWSGRNAEVTRYSTRYGIEGRVDLVAEDDDEGLQIVELKSGKTWDGHLSQLRFYRFLWEGLAEARGLEVTGHLLYSRHGRMKEAAMQDTDRERRILRARNELLACLRSFVDADYTFEAPFYMQKPRLCRASACNFRRKRCEAQTEVLGLADEASPWSAVEGGHWAERDPELVARAWAFHQHFARLIEKERWACIESLGAVLHPDRYEERLANYAASEPMRLAAARADSGYVDFVGPHRRIFSPGDYVVAHRDEFERAHILRGRVVAVDGDRLTLASPGAPAATTLADEGWIIDKLPAKIGFRQAHHALYGALATGDDDRLDVLLRPDSARATRLATRPEEAREVAADQPADVDQLNESQCEAVELALT
ncbi:MAG: PLuB system helicase-like protein, partial [Persicimonas sp.]